jgi:hypothetical protein
MLSEYRQNVVQFSMRTGKGLSPLALERARPGRHLRSLRPRSGEAAQRRHAEVRVFRGEQYAVPFGEKVFELMLYHHGREGRAETGARR